MIKLDLSRAAAAPVADHAPAVRVLNYSGSGIETTFTQGEDACLAVAGAEMPPSGSARRSLLVVGALADVVEDQFARLFAELGIGVSASCRRAAPASCRRSGRDTRFLLAQPFLADTARRWKSAAPSGSPRRSRSGAEGTTRLAAGGGRGLRRRRRRVSSRSTAPRPRAAPNARSRATATRSPASAIFFFPDSQLEMPLARFLARELGMELVEVGTPYLHRQHLADELGAAAAGHAR